MRTSDSKRAVIATVGNDEPIVCLTAKYETTKGPKKSGNWYIDSGCSNHMTHNKYLFSSYSSGSNSSVELGNNNVANVCGSGTIDITLVVNNTPTNCRHSNVLHVPDLGYQLLSVITLDKSGLRISLFSGRCEIKKNSSLLATGQ